MRSKLVPFLMSALFIISVSVFGQEEEKRPWTNVAELSAVVTGGNSEATTYSFKNDYNYAWDSANFNFKIGGFRADSTTFSRFATGTADNFVIVEEKTTETTAEKYFMNLKYDRKINEKFFWFTGLDWDRNEFAGIDNRYALSAGVGNIWVDTDRRKFRTDYGIQYTKEDLIFEQPGFDDSYASAIASYKWFEAIGKNSTFTQDFKFNLNLDDTDDFRAELDNGFATAISSKVALKIGLLFLFDNQPAFTRIQLQNTDVFVPLELDELDTVFTTSLVINF